MKQVINRIDHVVYLSRLETIDQNIARREALTGASFQRCERLDMGAMICVDWAAGLEIVAPLQPCTKANESLHQRIQHNGEGLLAIVFGVKDLELHKRQLESRGEIIGPLMVGDPAEPWYDQLILRERFGPPIMDSWLVFSQIEYGNDIVALGETLQDKI